MSLAHALRGPLGAAALLMVSLAPTTRAQRPANDEPVRVSAADVAQSNAKIAQAYSALVDMWAKDFKQIGEQFVAPRIVRYTDPARTACGVIRPMNAQYCEGANAIYYDEVFVAGMAKAAAAALHTDGDMTGIGIIAHEMGHAVAMQLGHRYRNSYDNESVADCLAGAFANEAQKNKQLEDGDIEEALFGMAMAGDPVPQPTGNERYDAIIQARLARESHGTKDQRVQNFRNGLNGGAGACLAEFRSIRS